MSVRVCAYSKDFELTLRAFKCFDYRVFGHVRKIANYVHARDADNGPWIIASVLYCDGIVELSTAITVTRPLSGLAVHAINARPSQHP